MASYHLLAITDAQRRALLDNDLEDIGVFLRDTLASMEGRATIGILPTGAHTMRPAELSYLVAQHDDLSAKANEHETKGLGLVSSGFEVSGEYDLDMARKLRARADELFAQIGEIRAEMEE